MINALKKHIFTIFVTAAAVALAITLAVTFPAAKKEYRLVYVIKTTDRMAFWNTLRVGMETAAKETGAVVEIRGVELENDVAGQNVIIEQAVSEKPDAILLSAADFEAQAELCQKIADAGITLVTVDSDVNSEAKKCFVGTDSYHAGFLAGEAVSVLVPDDGEIALISTVQFSQTGMDRVDGFMASLTDAQRKNVVGPYFSGSVVENAYDITMDILREHPDLDGIACMNEPSFTGAVLALKDCGVSAGDMSVSGIDSSMYTIQALEEGLVDAIVIQNPFNMGYLGVTTAVDILNGKTVPAHVDTGEYVITKENMYEPENQKLLFIFEDSAR